MASNTQSKSDRLGFRISPDIKLQLLNINPEYAIAVREAISLYIPVKQLMLNPLAVPRSIDIDGNKIEFSVSADNKFQMVINNVKMTIEPDALKGILANIFLFNLSTVEV